MNKWILLLCLLAPEAWSQQILLPKMAMDEVVFQRTQTQWVTTKAALVRVNVNAALNDMDLVKARSTIQASLVKIAPGEWHLTGFNRSQDNSGLEKLEATAEARVMEEHLSSVYAKAKTLSRPGISYSVQQIEFKPSAAEEQAVKDQLRTTLYEQVNKEISALNKAYPEQHYSVHRLVFWEGDAMPLQQLPRGGNQLQALAAVNTSNANASIALSREVTMTAMIELASNRKNNDAPTV
ncbi:MAG: hypothetical protein H2069_08750 [Legionella sp.]|nr:hypothetical protein [Legionella sp.]